MARTIFQGTNRTTRREARVLELPKPDADGCRWIVERRQDGDAATLPTRYTDYVAALVAATFWTEGH